MNPRALPLPLFLALLAPTTRAQSASDYKALENRVQQLEGQLQAVAGQMETIEMGDVMPEVGASQFGMGPAASKIYQKDQGLSIGGYGEAVYTAPAGDGIATADFVRAIVYFGYKFDSNWTFNSEIEVEHADEIFLEFAYLEYRSSDALNVRAGMMLVPMGHINEMHEPTTFRGPGRPATESRILPSTWREGGVGVLGTVGDFSYRLYGMNGFNGEGFDETGLRGGRQKGSKARAEDLATVARLDYAPGNGLELGVSGYMGHSGQGNPATGDAPTSIFDIHGQYQTGPLRVRGLYARAMVDNTEELFAGNGGDVVGEEMMGWYLEGGYDVASLVAPGSGHQVIPFVRYEEIDTHAKVASSLTRDPLQDDRVVTMGIDWKPMENIVFKVAYQDWDQAADSVQASMGYVF